MENEKADRLADEGRRKNAAPVVDMQIPRNLWIPGVKLKTITQSSAYRIIRAQKVETAAYEEALDRLTTDKNLVYAQDGNRLQRGRKKPHPSSRSGGQSETRAYPEASPSSSGW